MAAALVVSKVFGINGFVEIVFDGEELDYGGEDKKPTIVRVKITNAMDQPGFVRNQPFSYLKCTSSLEWI